MASYSDLIISDNNRTQTAHQMLAALERMQEIMAEPVVSSQRGYAFSDDDVMQLQRGKEALESIIQNPQSHQDRILNEQRFAEGGKGVEVAVMLLHRDGFDAVRSEGSATFENDAYNDSDMRQMDRALARFDRVTAYARN